MQFIAIRWSGGRVMDILITYQTHSQEISMNIAKNMEGVFIAAPFEGKMQVVTIVGKRLTAAEKANVAP